MDPFMPLRQFFNFMLKTDQKTCFLETRKNIGTLEEFSISIWQPCLMYNIFFSFKVKVTIKQILSSFTISFLQKIKFLNFWPFISKKQKIYLVYWS